MHAASSATSLATALLLTVDLLTLLARLAINAAKLVIVCPGSILRFRPLLTSPLTVSRDCPQKATNGDLTADTVDLGVTPVPSVAPVA